MIGKLHTTTLFGAAERAGSSFATVGRGVGENHPACCGLPGSETSIACSPPECQESKIRFPAGGGLPARAVDVFDAAWQPVNLGSAFTDPDLPAGYAPFNVQVLGGAVYVAYALQGEDGEEEVTGHTLGFVDKYTDFGQTVQRIASRGNLNAPWGLAIAPGSFGKYAGALLIGNFGDGKIGAYTDGGEYLGFLRDRDNHIIAIDRLWALLPGTATSGGTDAVWFSAGPDEETHGLLGVLRPAS
jgi:uncharacterized protein (TIGR03118 family)